MIVYVGSFGAGVLPVLQQALVGWSTLASRRQLAVKRSL